MHYRRRPPERSRALHVPARESVLDARETLRREQKPRAFRRDTQTVSRKERKQVVLYLILESPVEPVRPTRARHVYRRLRLVREKPRVVHLVLRGHGGGVVPDVQLKV